MIAIVLTLIAGVAISVLGTAAFFVIVINIHMVDRSKRLMQEPHSFLDATTRRLLGNRWHGSHLDRTKEG